MEFIVQYMDDLEDLVYAFALKWERIRRAGNFTIFVIIAFLLQVLVINLAFSYPPMAIAIASLLAVALLYYGATRTSDHRLPKA